MRGGNGDERRGKRSGWFLGKRNERMEGMA
jgi:hypothetical protein